MLRRPLQKLLRQAPTPPAPSPEELPELAIRLPDANVPLLDAQLREAFGAAVSGLSYDGTTVRIHFLAAPTETQEAQAEALIAAHDPTAVLPPAAVIPTLPDDADDATADTVLSVAIDRLATNAELPITQRVEAIEQAVDVALRAIQRQSKKTAPEPPTDKPTGTKKKTAK